MPETSQDLFNKIRKIQIHTTQLANDLLAGAWHSAFKGRGMEFEEVREYQMGDEIRSIDWNVTARMNHPYVKVFREERELTVILIVDVSASSKFGSKNQIKQDLIAEIGAVLAFSAIKNNDNVGLILFSEEIEKYIPPKKGPQHVLRVIRELLGYKPKWKGTNFQKALDFAGTVLIKSSICFLISDFICDLEQQELTVLATKHDFIGIHVADPCELEFPEMGLVALEDLESGQQQTVDSSDQKLQKHYQEMTTQRVLKAEKMMKEIGADFIHLRTDRPYLAPLRKFFKGRESWH